MLKIVFNSVLYRLAECCDIPSPPPISIRNSVTRQPVQTRQVDGLCGTEYCVNPLSATRAARGMKIVKKNTEIKPLFVWLVQESIYQLLVGTLLDQFNFFVGAKHKQTR